MGEPASARLQRYKEAAEKATPGPWEGGYYPGSGCELKANFDQPLNCVEYSLKPGPRKIAVYEDMSFRCFAYEPFIQFEPEEYKKQLTANFEFMALSREALPDAVRIAEEGRAFLKEIGEHYASGCDTCPMKRDNYQCPVKECGARLFAERIEAFLAK